MGRQIDEGKRAKGGRGGGTKKCGMVVGVGRIGGNMVASEV